MTNVADVILAVLKDASVKRIYGLPGDSLNGLTDALRREGSIAWQHVRHEEAAALAAAAEASLTGELAVCVGSCGPGSIHLINGLYDANRSRVPVLAIAAQIPGPEMGSSYFQETRPQDAFREASVYCELVSMPEQLPRVLEIAMRTALERRGVAVVVIPGEIFLTPSHPRRPTAPIHFVPRVVRPTQAGLQAAADLLNAGQKVTIFGGAGVEGAHDELIAIAAKLKAPVVHALRGKQFIEYDNPYDVGMTGLLGFASGYRAIESCDVLLMLGTDFPYQQFYPSKAKIIQVDLRGENLGRRTPIDLGLVGSVKDTVEALLPLLTEKQDATHLQASTNHYIQTRKGLDDLAVDDHNRTPIHPQYLTRMVSDLASEDAVFIPDVGSPTGWAARYLRMNGKRRLIGSFNHGTMANALPHAIGAQSAFPGRQVVALSGDGGLSMLLGELLTLRQNKLPVKIVLFDNSSLNFVELEMKASGFVNFGTNLENPDFAEVARSLGLFGQRVEKPQDLEAALKAAFAHDGPSLVDVVTAREELLIPPTISVQQAKGFSLFALRTILAGRGEELLDLADTNVVRRLFA
ncbi:MAG: ubiquinone-dependent pyruvate dehydrogenase [Cyanobacteriota bacterium]|nr:ubiquinone-dependent pyruvate dehydrogenase [Cyanobacteriota bacterium]